MKLLHVAIATLTVASATEQDACTLIDIAQQCVEAESCAFDYHTASCVSTTFATTNTLRGGSSGKSTDLTAGLISFVTLGDWGGAALEDYHKTDELAVAKTLSTSAADLNAQFLVNVGDNFYYYGVNSTEDPQWQGTFESVYTASSLSIPWYSILGNHDYGFNPDAQLQYKSPNNDRWVMPSRYYTKRVQIGTSGKYISFIFLDASPCQAIYRSSDSSGWDPCGGSYPGPADCKFNANVLAQDCGKQLTWLKSVVPNIPVGDWKIAASHAPFDELDVEDLTSILQTAKFDMYLNGHVHNLAQYSLDNDGGTYIQSGAGCMVEIKAALKQLNDYPNKKIIDKHMEYRENVTKTGVGHSYHQIWDNKIAGFTTHTFSSDYSKLTTTYVDNNGNKIHTVITTRGAPAPTPTPGPSPGPSPGPTPGPSPGPAPGPAPAPTGKCCWSRSTTCSPGDMCCKSSCTAPSKSCSYTERGCSGEYGKKHSCEWDSSTSTCVVGGSANVLFSLS